MKRLCIHWPRFGPLHLARLRATHAYFALRSVDLVGLETASDDDIYEWRVESDEETFQRVQIFPGRNFNAIPPAEMHARTLETLDRLDPDAVATMSYGYPDARAALVWCRRNRRACIIMMASKEDDAERVGWRERVKSLVVKQFDAAIVGGAPQRDYMRKLGIPGDAVFTKYNAVDNTFFATGAAEARAHPERHRHLPGLETSEPFFFTSNRFIRRKNLDRLLLAYEAYRNESEHRGLAPWRLLMLGDGELRTELEALVAERQIDGVTFCGFQQIEDLPAYYGLASAFVHPALTDQWALVVNEAMAARLPVIVSTGAGCSQDLVDEGRNGFTFAPENSDALTQHLLTMADPATDREAMGTRSEEIVAGWAPERFAESMWSAWEAAQKRANRPANPITQFLLTSLNRFSKDIKAFHTVEA